MNAVELGHKPKSLSLDFPDTPAGRRAWLKAALSREGLTLGALARDLGVARTTVVSALQRGSLPIARELAERVGVEPEAIWPERYAARTERAARRGGGR